MLPTLLAGALLSWWGKFTSGLSFITSLSAAGNQRTPQLAKTNGEIRKLLRFCPDIPRDILEDAPSWCEWRAWIPDIPTHNLEVLDAWAGKARCIYKKVRAKALAEAGKHFLAWVVEQSKPQNHSVGIYKWTADLVTPLSRSARGIWHRGVITKPLDLAEHRAIQWEQWWVRDPYALVTIKKKIADIDLAAPNDSVVKPSFAQFMKAIGQTKANTGKGLDDTPPILYEILPDEALGEWHVLTLDCLENRAWPWQLLCNAMVLAGKPGGDGERALALQNLLVRFLVRACQPVSQRWLVDKGRFYDDALAGSSALKGAVLQLIAIEYAEITQQLWALASWDLQKFFDTVSLAALVVKALRRQFPPLW